MADLQKAANNFEEFSNTVYQFTISYGKRFEDKKVVKLSFDLKDFAHALGITHLTDIIEIDANVPIRDYKIFQDAKQGLFPESRLQTSKFYSKTFKRTYNTQTQQGYSIKDRIEKLTDIVSIIDEACKGLSSSLSSITLYEWREQGKKMSIPIPNGDVRSTKIQGMSYVFSIKSTTNPDEKIFLFAYNTDYIVTRKQDDGVCVRSAFADCIDLTTNQKIFPILKVEKIDKNHQKTELYYKPEYKKAMELQHRQSEIDNILNELRDEIKKMNVDDSGIEKSRKESDFLNYLGKFVKYFETEKECDYVRSALVKRHDMAKTFQKLYYDLAIDKLDERISVIQKAEGGKPKVINILPQSPVPVSANGANTLSLRSLLETIIPQSVTITFHPNNHFFRRLGHEIRKAVDKFAMHFVKPSKDAPPSDDEAPKDKPQSQLPKEEALSETKNPPQVGMSEKENPNPSEISSEPIEILTERQTTISFDSMETRIIFPEQTNYTEVQISLPLSNFPELTEIVLSEERQHLAEVSKPLHTEEQSHRRKSKQIDFTDCD